VTENYQETQYKTEYSTETYTDNQSTNHPVSGEYTLPCYYVWHSPNISFNDSTGISYYGYEIEEYPHHDNIHLRISFWPQLQNEPAIMRVFDVSKTGQLSSPDPQPEVDSLDDSVQGYVIKGNSSSAWLKSANSVIRNAKFLGGSNYIWSKEENPNTVLFDAGTAKSIAIIFSSLTNRWNGQVTVDILWTKDNVEYQQVTRERHVANDIPYQVQKQRIVQMVKQVPFWESIFTGE
jgi:hypothetical protein